MVELFFIVVPIFLVIVLGKIIQLYFVRDPESWASLNKINYWLLFPCLLFYTTSTFDFASVSFTKFSISLLCGFVMVL